MVFFVKITASEAATSPATSSRMKPLRWRSVMA